MPEPMPESSLELERVIAGILARTPGAEPLERLTAARATAARLEALAQHVVGHYVDQARLAGASWTQIGAALGVTRQAAQQRFVPANGLDLDSAVLAVGVPVTRRATTLLRAAARIASGRGQSAVEETHVLLAILDSRSGPAIAALRAGGHRIPEVRRAARAALGPEPVGAATSAADPGDGRGRDPRQGSDDGSGGDPGGSAVLGRGCVRALQVAGREALRAGADAVGPEHLLLAFASDPGSPAGRVLADARVGYDELRTALLGRTG